MFAIGKTKLWSNMLKKSPTNIIKQNAKVVLIISCVFAVISSVLLILMIYDFPQILEGRRATKYLYENGMEVEAYIKSYYKGYFLNEHGTKYAGNYIIVYEYLDENNNSFIDEYDDITVICRVPADWDAREKYINQMIADGTTKKMLIADNGLCCLSVYKESLISNKNLAISISVISVSSIVLCLCIFGIVRQSKKLKLLKKGNDT